MPSYFGDIYWISLNKASLFHSPLLIMKYLYISALDIANLYKKRWLVELFFKWLEQHHKIKEFWGTMKNAVRIQISVAIITYCFITIVQHDMQLKCSTYEVLQILSISLTNKTNLRDLFDKTNFNNAKNPINPF